MHNVNSAKVQIVQKKTGKVTKVWGFLEISFTLCTLIQFDMINPLTHLLISGISNHESAYIPHDGLSM